MQFYRFVSAIHIPKSDPSSLISGGGDPMLKIWDWATGVTKHSLSVLEVVEPFIVIRASKKKRGGDDDEGASEGAGKKSKGQRRKENKKKTNLNRLKWLVEIKFNGCCSCPRKIGRRV